MTEIELKFQLAPKKLKRIRQALAKQPVQQIQLQANYYDTPDRLLAKHGIALRLRKEGEYWVQTYKSSAQNHLERVENEIHLGKLKDEPELNLELFSTHQTIMQQLDNALGDNKDNLVLQFKTDVLRHFFEIGYEESRIEVCLDEGIISTAEQEQQICEVEFELISGRAEELILATKAWVKKYDLWLDVRSKAARGHLMAVNKTVSEASKASPLTLNASDTPQTVLSKIVANCLDQLLPNSAIIAEGNALPEHVHQARVAIRRLRSAFKSFSGWSEHFDKSWQKQLKIIFSELGQTRDKDVIQTEIWPELVTQDPPFGAFPSSLTENQSRTLEKMFRTPEYQLLILDLLVFSYLQEPPYKTSRIKQQIKKILDPVYLKITNNAALFNSLHPDEQHQVRKDTKQLRYDIEFVSSLYPDKKVQAFLKQLEKSQKILGRYNDFYMAEQFFREHANTQPEYWFAAGWCKAKQAQYIEQAQLSLEELANTSPFW